MVVSRVRTVWGIDPGNNFENWAKIWPQWKQIGYDGVEVNIAQLTDAELPIVKKLAADTGLFTTAMSFSLWPNYIGPRPVGATAQDHLAFYRTQLEKARTLGVKKVNCQSGCDSWPVSESVAFYKGTFAIDAEYGFAGRVCHETHRNRSLFNPYQADAILKEVPELRVTADVSHWMCVCERILTHQEDKEILARFVPHVHHIHARMGTTQASQCPEPTNPVFADERAFFEGFWQDCIDAHYKRGDDITFVPEYGPFPYHPINSKKTFSEVADDEGLRLHGFFNERLAVLSKSA